MKNVTKSISVAVASAILLSACSMPNFVPAHDQSFEEQAAARLECKAISEGMTPPMPGGFVAASGKPAFVAGAMGGYALGLLIAAGVRQQQKVETYSDCMEAHGFRKVQS